VLECWFHLKERGTTVRTEILGGLTTFAAMAYIIVVNPAILSVDGQPIGPLTVATILAAMFGSLLMGLYANRPLAVAPYMGENAFIAYALIGWVTWEQRLATVFIAGVIFLLITVLRLRTWLANAISPSMKYSFSVGIGLFLAFIGLTTIGLVIRGPNNAVPVQLAPLHVPAGMEEGSAQLAAFHVQRIKVLLGIGGFIVISLLLCLRLRGAILVGIVLTGVAGYLAGIAQAPTGVVEVPDFGPNGLGQIALRMDLPGVLTLTFLPVLLTLVLVSFLDTLGTLIGVGASGDMLDEHGNFPQVERPMLVDAASCVFSALVGTSTSGAFIESAAGVREGARTGLAAITVALLFAVSLFFIPLVAPLQELGFAYGPALIAVGVLMLGSVRKIEFEDMTEGVPAFATIVMMMFTYNIANGLTAGLILYPLMKMVTGRWRDLNLGSIVLGLLCLVYYVFGLPH
jgi:AGZA family xanthine/uracil permease-like MFS transporter